MLLSLAWQVAVSRGERDLWFEAFWIPPTLLVSLLCFIAFIWWDSRPQNADPVFHLRMIWRQAAVRTSLTVVILIVGAILGAGLFVVPQYLRYVQDYSATQTGGFISMYTTGLGLGLVFSLRVLLPRYRRSSQPLDWAYALLTADLRARSSIFGRPPLRPESWLPLFFFKVFALAPALLGASNVATANALASRLE